MHPLLRHIVKGERCLLPFVMSSHIVTVSPGELSLALTLAISPFLLFARAASKWELSSSHSHFPLFNHFKTSDAAGRSTCE